jgi:hypothetical protein
MRLKLEELKKVVDQTLSEERSVKALRDEISRVLGPSVVTNVRLDQLAEGANYRIDVLERTGRFHDVDFDPTVLLKFVNSKSIEARKLAARMLPENFAVRLRDDDHPAVRHAYAKRTTLSNAIRMLKENPRDHELKYIIRQKRLEEGGIPQPAVVSEPFDMYGEKLGDAVKQQPGSELSDVWYESTARKFIQDYGTNLEGNWEELIAKRYCSSVKATSLVDVDEGKLYQQIIDQIRDREDRILQRFDNVNESRTREIHSRPMELKTNKMNPMESLLRSKCSSTEYVRKTNALFSIVESLVPLSLQKYRLSEGLRGQFTIPHEAKIPGSGKITSLVESVLDRYVKSWNDISASNGEPVKINWFADPLIPGVVIFSAELSLTWLQKDCKKM